MTTIDNWKFNPEDGTHTAEVGECTVVIVETVAPHTNNFEVLYFFGEGEDLTEVMGTEHRSLTMAKVAARRQITKWAI